MTEEKPKKKNYRGKRNPFKEGGVGELYIQIYLDKMYFHLSDWELAKKFDYSTRNIKRALEWVNKNFIKIPNKMLLRGALFQLEERIKHLTELIEIERAKEIPSVRSIVELNREIREDSRDKLKLQNLYTERYEFDLEGGGESIKAILQALTAGK